MSERRDSTCQKHELPKSLQGTEDAEFVWSMITERFPNAAPLLCEMEAVIDRAEDLLQQLRAPCREIETSTSFCTQDSEESTAMISAKESATENDIVENDIINKNVAETQVSESSIYETEINLNKSQDSVIKEQDTESQSLDLITLNNSNIQKHSSEESSLVTETNNYQMVKEAHSLEEWGKIVDNALQENTGINNDYENYFLLFYFKLILITDEVQSVKKTINMFEKRVNCEETKTEKHEDSCIILHRQETDAGDSVIQISSERNTRPQKLIEINDGINVSIKVKKNYRFLIIYLYV
ncbi:uncharacterized protein LOC100867434 isoform X1 [Apis florea]|uniref:uncharacterized protein LOC100867434 isoform X1 n=1 Tax=Apis florea TaxID=7463 RepID=UPI0012FF105B|nr:uncharacterized protein LOC100867434 isoform X1 [Apis florea]